jgi:hypothetical protein
MNAADMSRLKEDIEGLRLAIERIANEILPALRVAVAARVRSPSAGAPPQPSVTALATPTRTAVAAGTGKAIDLRSVAERITLSCAASVLARRVGRPCCDIEEVLKTEVDRELATGKDFDGALDQGKATTLEKVQRGLV